MKPSIGHSIWRAVVAAVSFGIPLVAMALPGWEGITLGTIVYTLLRYAQTKKASNRPGIRAGMP
jgi:hypothetical protein